MRKLLVAAAVLVVAVLGAAHYYVRMAAYKDFEAPVYVEIPKGTSSLRIGELLEEKGVLRSAVLFPLARLTRPGGKPQAGEYEFLNAATPAEIFARMARGDVYMVELRIPEGSTVFEISELVERGGLGTAREFVEAALPQEGYLFPATYRFKRASSVQDVVKTLRAQFDKVWAGLHAASGAQTKAVVLASLVEAEAKLDEERPRIAAVYQNRLAKGMKLECDPTVEYAARLAGEWRGTIYKTDLARKSKYNTYLLAGLPPGPVSNPGLKSLRAALNPATSQELYFVAKPDGSGAHIFSKDYADHQKAVQAYRHGERASREKSKGARLAGVRKPKGD